MVPHLLYEAFCFLGAFGVQKICDQVGAADGR